MALQFTQAAIQSGAEPEDVAKAAVKDAVSAANAEEAENLGIELYKEATGRFPQRSVDRKAVYLGGFILGSPDPRVGGVRGVGPVVTG